MQADIFKGGEVLGKWVLQGKSRFEKTVGEIPETMFFVHADALQSPFEDNTFCTVISLNLLHCIDDVKPVLKEIKRVLKAGGNSAITTLVKSHRCRNRYLNILAKSWTLFSRNAEELLSAFRDMEMHVSHNVKGTLAFIKYG